MKNKHLIFQSFICYLLLNSFFACAQSRERKSFNEDWLLQKTDTLTAFETNFDDTSWRKLSVPHDWAIEGPFKPEYNLRTGGLPVFGKAWYRKHFSIDSSKKGEIVTLEFDGIMSNSTIFINGKKIYKRPYGYIGFEIDISSYINYGEKNVIAISLQPEVLGSRWYPGAGIYRNVWLETKNKPHIKHWETQISTPSITDEKATVAIETTIENFNKKETKKAILETTIFDESGNKVASSASKINLKKSKSSKIKQNVSILNTKKWDFETPHLYKVASQILENNIEIDQYSSSFGIRTIKFSREGFFLNRKKEKIKGVCLHHDLGPLGAAVNYRATERQLQIMKEMGINAIRTSHNPPSPEQLELCDKIGITALILKNRLPSDEIMENKSIGPLQVAQESITFIRRNVAKWSFNSDKIGILGYFAGGHLAASLSTKYDEIVYQQKDSISAKPNSPHLIYPIISMTIEITHKSSRKNLLGNSASEELIEQFSTEKLITAETPPSFLVHAIDDKSVTVENSINYFLALKKNKIISEMPLYQNGDHGFGLGKVCTREFWMTHYEKWL